MKRWIPIFLCFLLFSNICYAAPTENEGSISPAASYVFIDVCSSIDPDFYGGDCSLLSRGSGTITITLQRQSTYDNAWRVYDGETSTKSFSNTGTYAYSQDRTLTTAGKYRCKTVAEATVGSYHDTSTVYSPTLTIYNP